MLRRARRDAGRGAGRTGPAARARPASRRRRAARSSFISGQIPRVGVGGAAPLPHGSAAQAAERKAAPRGAPPETRSPESPYAASEMNFTASPKVWIVSAASSGISIPNSSSKAMTSSTVSRLSAPRSSMNEAILGHLVLFDAQMLDDDLLHAISDVAHVRSSVLVRAAPALSVPAHVGSRPLAGRAAPRPRRNSARL